MANPIPAEVEARVSELLLAGLSVREVAKSCRVSVGKVASIRATIPRNEIGASNPAPEVLAEVVEVAAARVEKKFFNRFSRFEAAADIVLDEALKLERTLDGRGWKRPESWQARLAFDVKAHLSVSAETSAKVDAIEKHVSANEVLTQHVQALQVNINVFANEDAARIEAERAEVAKRLADEGK